MRLVMVSNRLPFTITKEQGKPIFSPSVGGLATGLRSYLNSLKETQQQLSHLWVGWPGITATPVLQSEIAARALNEHNAYPVFVPKPSMDKFYFGFCNKTIWPLFHYFPSFAIYDEGFWEQYQLVNQMFCDAMAQVLHPDDIVWVHDYQLMLLPKMLRRRFPQMSIGFFLHIPFPSLELYRLLPRVWRNEILHGILGADLIGFHTYDYTQYFLRCVARLLGYEHNVGRVVTASTVVRVDTFPMGIDFDKYAGAPTLPEVARARSRYSTNVKDRRIVLSVDRLDYSKGIANRLRGFAHFLASHKQWHGQIVLIMVVVPSREGVEQYQQMKSQVDELVGEINGKYGTIGWTPVIYQYRSLAFNSLTALYSMSDIALVTPLRDGMNLVAKEYLAARTDNTGVLILSEMAGASSELGEAVMINPNSVQEISDAILEALELPLEDQIRRNKVMRERLERYSVTRWATDFMTELAETKLEQRTYETRILTSGGRSTIIGALAASTRRVFLLDYDGTLVPFADRPEKAIPPPDLKQMLKQIARHENTDICIISGRDRGTLHKWFSDLPVGMVAEHGVWFRRPNEEWTLLQPVRNDWKEEIRPILFTFADRLPGAYVEEKEYSLVWHYRRANPELAALRTTELVDSLVQLTANIDLQVLHGNKVIEIRIAGINKGSAAMRWLSQTDYDFIFAAGDDWTDEDMFRLLPETALSVRVGMVNTLAKYNVNNQIDLLALLTEIAGTLARTGRKEKIT